VFDLVSGDVVHLQLGAVVPADVRLLEASGLTCHEAVLTGESLPSTRPPQRSRPAPCSRTKSRAR
jgi:Mg2+-importing ATPase